MVMVSRGIGTVQKGRKTSFTLAPLEFCMVKSRDHLIRLKRFQADERRRRVAQIESMVADFSRMAVDLDREIATEEQRSGISDPNHFAYPTYARAAVVRRDNLKRSTDELREQLDEARALLGDAQDELKKAETIDSRDKAPLVDVGRPDRDMAMVRLARA